MKCSSEGDTSMELIQKILENEAFWSFITIITSFVIVKITLKAEQKINKLNLEIQQNQQKTELETQERLHIESIEIEKEQVRANLLPFLKLEQNIEIEKRDTNYVFPLKVTNYGNSGAFEISVQFETLKNRGLCYVCKEDLGKEIRYYQYTDFLFDNVLPVGQSATFGILLDICIDGLDYQNNNEFVAGEIQFSILFKDSLYNQYKQAYMIQYTSTLGSGRVESYLPQLVKKMDK